MYLKFSIGRIAHARMAPKIPTAGHMCGSGASAQLGMERDHWEADFLIQSPVTCLLALMKSTLSTNGDFHSVQHLQLLEPSSMDTFRHRYLLLASVRHWNLAPQQRLFAIWTTKLIERRAEKRRQQLSR